MKLQHRRVSDRVAYIVLFFSTFELAGTTMSLGRAAVYVHAVVVTLVWGAFLATMLFVPEFFAQRSREHKRRLGLCPTCDYEIPSEGTQRCPECGIETSQSARTDTGQYALALSRKLEKCAKLVLMAYIAALVLTLFEYATTYAFGKTAFEKAAALKYGSTRRTSGGWVIDAYQEASVFGGTVYDFTEFEGISPEIFRATRWTPWLHLGDVLYVENGADSRVFTYCGFYD